MAVKNEHGLTPQQERFAMEVAKGNSLAESYRIAYPASKAWKDDSVHNKASALKRHAQVAARIRLLAQKVEREFVVDKARVLQEIARLAFFDIRKLLNEDGTPIPIKSLDDDTAAAIAGLDVARVGNAMIGEAEVLKFKIADKNAALEKLAKHLGLFEIDNKQKADPIAEALKLLGGNIMGPGKAAPAREDEDADD